MSFSVFFSASVSFHILFSKWSLSVSGVSLIVTNNRYYVVVVTAFYVHVIFALYF